VLRIEAIAYRLSLFIVWALEISRPAIVAVLVLLLLREEPLRKTVRLQSF